jgi:hypothetical protein
LAPTDIHSCEERAAALFNRHRDVLDHFAGGAALLIVILLVKKLGEH